MNKLSGHHKYKPEDLDSLIQGTLPDSTNWLIYTQFQAAMRENERLRKALEKEIICVCQGISAGSPVKIYHHRYCPNNPNKDTDNG